MKRILILSSIIITLFFFLLCGYAIYKSGKLFFNDRNSIAALNLQDKKAAVIVAFRGYQEREYNDTIRALKNAGVRVTTVSSSPGKARGTLVGRTKVDLLISDVSAKDFDAVIFIGGSGAKEYVEDPVANELIIDVFEQDKILGAICVAPTALTKVGVLKGSTVAEWFPASDSNISGILKENCAEYAPSAVMIEGKIVIANGADASFGFGMTLVELLSE